MRIPGQLLTAMFGIPVFLCMLGDAALAEKSQKMMPGKQGYTAIIRFGAAGSVSEPAQPSSTTVPVAKILALPAVKAAPVAGPVNQPVANAVPVVRTVVPTVRKVEAVARAAAPAAIKAATVAKTEALPAAKAKPVAKPSIPPVARATPVARPTTPSVAKTAPVAKAEITAVSKAEPVAKTAAVPIAKAPAADTLPPSAETTASIVENSSQGLASFELRSELQGFVAGAPGLRGALETALGRDAGWHAALMDVKVADREVWRELLKFTPVITGSLQSNKYSAANGSQPLDLRDNDNYVAVSATLPIWTSGSRYYGVKAARSRRESLAYDAMAVRDQATMKLIETWTQAVSGVRERELGLNAIKRFKRLRSAVVARQKAGFASSSDIAQVDADIAAATQALSSIEGALAKSSDTLLRLSGQKLDRTAELARFDNYLRDGREAFIQSAHRNNPQLRAAASRYRTEIYSTRSAMSRLLPSVNLTGEYRHYLDNPRRSSGNEGLTIGVRLQVPILDLSTFADTTAQSARKEAALYRETATLNAVETEIDGLWSDRKATIAMRSEADREVAARKKSAVAARDRFEKGFGSLEEAIRAETALLTSQRTALQLAAQESVIAAQLLVISGRFDVSMME